MAEEYSFSAEELSQPSQIYEPTEFTFTPEELSVHEIKGKGRQYNIKTKQPIPTSDEQQVEAMKRDPAYRREVARFIHLQAKPKSLKREMVEGLPLGNYIADRTMPFEYDPEHYERTVDEIFGPAASAKTVPGAMLQGLGKFLRDPGRQIEGAITFPADVATTITKAFAGDKQAQQQVRSMPADMLAMTGVPDIVEGNFDAPLAREAWENNFLGSAMMAYPTAKGTVGLGRMTKQGLGKVGKVGIRAITKPETAESLYRSAMKPTTKIGEQAAVGQAVQHGLKKGAVINRQGTGLEATLQRIDSAENALQNILDTSTGELNIGNLDRSLDNVRQAAFDDLVNRDTIQGAADSYIQMLREHPKYNPATDSIPADVANVIKRKLYKNLRKGGAYDTGQVLAGKGEAAKGLARGVMVELENVLPELGPLNKEMSKDLNLQRYLEKATARIQNSDTISLRGKLAMMLGFVKPSYAGASFLAAVADHPGFKSRLAIAIARAHKGKIGIAEARKLADTAVARMSEPQPAQQEPFNPEVPGQRGPSTGFETIPMEPVERGLEAGERRFENPPTINLEQMIANPEALPPRQSSAVETTGRPVSGPGLEEGGVPPEVMTKPRVENPEQLPPKQSSYSDVETAPQGNTNVDLGAMEQSLRDLGYSDSEIAQFRPTAMKVGAAAAIAALPFISDDDKKKLLAGGLMLGVLSPYESMKKPSSNSIFRSDVYAQNLLNAEGKRLPWMKHAKDFPPPEAYGIDVSQATKAGHTSPHIFTVPDIYRNIRTGEGATIYGEGFYSHTTPEVKKFYESQFNPRGPVRFEGKLASALEKGELNLTDEQLAMVENIMKAYDKKEAVDFYKRKAERDLEQLEAGQRTVSGRRPVFSPEWQDTSISSARQAFKRPDSFVEVSTDKKRGYKVKINHYMLANKLGLKGYGEEFYPDLKSAGEAAKRMNEKLEAMGHEPVGFGNTPSRSWGNYESYYYVIPDSGYIFNITTDKVNTPGRYTFSNSYEKLPTSVDRKISKLFTEIDNSFPDKSHYGDPLISKEQAFQMAKQISSLIKSEMADFYKKRYEKNPELYENTSASQEQIDAAKAKLKDVQAVERYLNSKNGGERKAVNYEVDLPNEQLYLRWDLPLEQQSKYVQDRLENIMGKYSNGQTIYKELSARLGGNTKASRYLESLGIAGVKYPQGAMTGGTGRGGKFNYVTMSDDLVNINKMYTHPATIAASAALLYKLLGNDQDDSKLPVNAVIGAIAASGMLKPAILRDGVVKSAPLGKTHYDVRTIEHGAKLRTEKTAGFITPDGEYLDRKQSLQWLRDHAPEVYEKLDETTKRHGLESTALSSASGNKSHTDSLADAFMRRQFGVK